MNKKISNLYTSTIDFLKFSRCISVHLPGEREMMMEEYRSAFNRIKPLFEEKIGTNLDDVTIREGGPITIYGRFLKNRIYEKIPDSENAARYLSVPLEMLATGMAGALAFPFWMCVGYLNEAFSIGNEINVNVGSSEFSGRLYNKNKGENIQGDLEEEIARHLVNIHWNKNGIRGKGEDDWRIGFNRFISTELFADDYSTASNEVIKESLYPSGKVMRIREIKDHEGLKAVLNLPKTWKYREEEMSMKGYVKLFEPPQRRERERKQMKKMLKVMIPFVAGSIGLMYWATEYLKDSQMQTKDEIYYLEERK